MTYVRNAEEQRDPDSVSINAKPICQFDSSSIYPGSLLVPHLAQLRVDRPQLLFVEDMITSQLNKGDNSIGRDEQQRKKSYPIAKFTEIVILLGGSGLAFYHGLPRRNSWGFLITCAGLLCFMSGFAIILSLLP
jgi:hypothetical protein